MFNIQLVLVCFARNVVLERTEEMRNRVVAVVGRVSRNKDLQVSQAVYHRATAWSMGKLPGGGVVNRTFKK